ncbi:hypothetical protein AA0120_g12602 [Alternaria tenuissima]|nr:hypothetical protein AA0120_g12602 [Alternaria tenuissima]
MSISAHRNAPSGSDRLLKQPFTAVEPFNVARTTRKKRGIVTRIGFYSTGALVLGTLLIFASFCFISFLWWSDSDNDVWRRIMLRGWATRSVTLASLVLRSAITAQALAATAMLAALALHWHQVALPDAAAVSLLRFANPGPSSLILPLLRTRTSSIPSAGLFTLFLALTTILANITSTALLSDLRLDVIPGNLETVYSSFGVNLSSGRESGNDNVYEDFWRRRPDQYPSFAELSYPAITARRMLDTGLQVRAFLPIASSDRRSKVRTFSGTAGGVFVRTVCVRPRLDAVFTEVELENRLTGTVWPDLYDDDVTRFGSSSEGKPFDCRTANDDDSRAYLCYFNSNGFLNFTKVDFGMSAGMLDTIVIPFLVLSFDKDFEPEPNEDSVWTRFEQTDNTAANETKSTSIAVSACVSMYRDQYLHIEATRESNITEPSLAWDFSSQRFSTLPIRRQLGSERLDTSTDERGIFKLESYSNVSVLTDYFASSFSVEQWAVGRQSVTPSWANPTNQNIENSTTIALAPSLYGPEDGVPSIERSQGAVLSDILNDTASPALLVQAYTTLQFRMAYYTDMLSYDLVDDMTGIQLFSEALRPRVSWGYWVVAAILVCHLGVVVVITAFYVCFSGDENILGNAWGAVGQLKSEEIEHVLDGTGTQTDHETRTSLKRKGVSERRVGLLIDRSGQYKIGTV